MIRLSEKVTAIKHSENGVSVTMANGKIYRGHLVIGADGVHSRVCSEMWRAAEKADPGSVTAHERTSESQTQYNSPNIIQWPILRTVADLKAEHSCIFGISSPIKGG
jgi:FAD dependent monooxygenase